MGINYSELLSEQRGFYKKQSNLLCNDEVKWLAGKDSFKGRLTGFLTAAYHKREKVIRTGEIFYGYVFQAYRNSLKDDSDSLLWILYSPEQRIMENPVIYKKITQNIRDFLKNENVTKKEKQLQSLLIQPLAAAPFEELPPSVSEGHLIYFIKMYLNRNFAYSFSLGLNLFISNLAISKQILYLPERYMTETFKKAYANHELVF